jgi:hypothetical protein
MPFTQTPADSDKLRELMLYIAQKAEAVPSFGSIKMNKVLFYSDFLWYARTGQSITGMKYVKKDRGPAPCGLVPVQEQLLTDQDATLEHRPVFPRGTEKRLHANRPPRLNGLFEPEQIAFVDNVFESVAPYSAKAISVGTHEHLGWRLADFDEEIPYYTVFLNDQIALPSDIQRGKELAEDRGWKRDSI